jgi:nucleoid-associated protein YgaU
MRRDVRMGFAVGGVLLAVIIVAFLAIHRNHNKAVAFDKGSGDAADTTAVDVNGPSGNTGSATPPPAGAVRDATAAKLNTEKAPDPKPAAEDKVENDRWDALFASTGPNPTQGQLTRGAAKNQPKTSGDRNSKAQPKTLALLDPAPAPSDAQQVPTADAPQPSTAPIAGVRTHTVHPNETLSGISKLVYGSSRHYKAIEAANPGLDATRLRPGMVLKIPPLEQAKQVVKQQAADATSAADGKTYTVQKDDNLYKITRKLYGNGEKQEALYELNKATIGNDSTKLKPGMVLKLPAAPAAQ